MTQALSDVQRWLVALSECLSAFNNNSVEELLPGDRHVRESIESFRTVLGRDWGINNRNELLDMLQFLKTGHNKNYMEISKKWAHLPLEQAHQQLQTIDDQAYKNNVRLILKNRAALRKCGIYAWDLGRAAYLIRSGALLDYITEPEAWQILLELGHEAQSLFDSWEHFGVSYVTGMAYWRLSDDFSQTHCQEAYNRHMHIINADDQHPWHTLKWALSLPESFEV